MSSRVRDAFWRLKNYFGILVLFLIGFLFFGLILFTIQENSRFLSAVGFTVAATSSDATAVLEVGDTPPQLSVVLNENSPITLIPNATTAIAVSARIIDQNGCSDITAGGSSTILVYRSGITSSTCMTTQNNLNCYLATVFTASSTCSTYFVDTTTTLGIYYFAEPTDVSNTLYSSQDWKATVIFRNFQNTTTSADSAGVDLNSMTAIGLNTSTINYGEVSTPTDTGLVNQKTGVFNAGNTTSSLLLHGTALTNGASVIATSSQHYATSSFDYGGSEQQLQVSATTVSGVTLLPRVSLVNNVGSWTDTTAYPNTLREFGAAAWGNYIFASGGFTGNHVLTSTVRFAQISGNGSVGSWTLTTALPAIRIEHPSFAYNGYLYVVGGSYGEFNSVTSSVLYAPINATGSIGSWVSTTQLPTTLTRHEAVVNNGYVYVLSGYTNEFLETTTSSVFYAVVNSDGSIGTWTSTQALPSPVAYYGAVVNKDYIYVVGGRDTITAGATSTVLYAPINSNGTVGSWATTTVLPSAISVHSVVVGSDIVGDYLYVIGGSQTSTVLYAPINSNGTVGAWATTTALGSFLYNHESVYSDGYIYALMGSSISQTSTVKYSQVVNGLSQRDIFWGVDVTGASASAEHSGVTTFTASYLP